MAFGPLLFGHRPPEIARAITRQLHDGVLYGVPGPAEVELCEEIRRCVPSIESLRLVSTGAEATAHAIRLARGYAGRKRILVFEGGYHGAHDAVLVKPGSGATLQGSAGIPEEAVVNTLVAPFNNLEATQELVARHGTELAAILVEPVLGNIGPVLPRAGFLEALRRLCNEVGALLIFDEVITGFRLALGGAQERYQIRPDLTTLGKILGGGLPLAAFGGRQDIMEYVAPHGKVYQAGTFNAHPVAVAAGLATLRRLRRHVQLYAGLERKGQRLRHGLADIVADRHIEAQVAGIGSMFQVFFTSRPVEDYASAKQSDLRSFERYFRGLLEQRIFIPASQFETCFLSTAHRAADLGRTLEAVEAVCTMIRPLCAK
jgi:glutamate-1-semialdehyde 2,1-aminomutase